MLLAGKQPLTCGLPLPSSAGLQEYFLSVLSQPREPRESSSSLEGYGPNGEGLPRGKSFAKRWLSRQFLSKARAQCGIDAGGLTLWSSGSIAPAAPSGQP
jgi:hypothetical protein